MSIINLVNLDKFPDGKHPVFQELFKKLSKNDKIAYFNHLERKDYHKKYCECVELLNDNEIDDCYLNYELRNQEKINSTKIIGGIYGKGYFN